MYRGFKCNYNVHLTASVSTVATRLNWICIKKLHQVACVIHEYISHDRESPEALLLSSGYVGDVKNQLCSTSKEGFPLCCQYKTKQLLTCHCSYFTATHWQYVEFNFGLQPSSWACFASHASQTQCGYVTFSAFASRPGVPEFSFSNCLVHNIFWVTWGCVMIHWLW